MSGGRLNIRLAVRGSESRAEALLPRRATTGVTVRRFDPESLRRKIADALGS